MVAWMAMILWPVISVVVFFQTRLTTAVSVTLIGGYLLLPTQTSLDLPLLPALDKYSIPALTALVLTTMMLGKPGRGQATLPGWLPRDRVTLLFLGLLVIGTFGMTLTNGAPIMNGSVYQQGLRPYDAFSICLSLGIALIPLFLGRKILATDEGQRQFLTVLVVAAVGYAFLALYEVRMSPQLNNMIYGFFPNSWLQHIRAGGFRPLVFLVHGLWLGIFFAVAALAAFGMALAEQDKKRRLLFLLAGLFILGTIVISKVLAALTITLLLLGVLIFPKRLQVVATGFLAGLILVYPVLRAADLVPTDQILRLAQAVDPARAESLAFRFDNENRILERARERPLFGWGGYGRDRIFNDEGRDTTTTDGRWIIVFAQGGWTRYVAEFGLLVWGGLSLLWRRRFPPFAVVITVMLIANLLDLLPNAGLSPVTYLMAGALIGMRERPEVDAAVEPVPDAPQAPVLRRDFSQQPVAEPPHAVPARAETPGYRRNLGQNYKKT